MSELLGLPFPLGFDLLQALPLSLGYLVLGIIVLGLVGASGFVLARLGIKPLWAVCLVVPFVQIISIWALAYIKWPRDSSVQKQTPGS